MSDRKVGVDSLKSRHVAFCKETGTYLSLRAFARKLIADARRGGSEDATKWGAIATKWFANKAGACNKERTPANAALAKACAVATRNTKRKPKGGKGGGSTTVSK